MANGIIIIDKPAGWTSMDVCPCPQKKRAIVGAPRTDFNSSAEVNSACGKVFPMGKRLYAPLGAMRTHREKECLYGKWYHHY